MEILCSIDATSLDTGRSASHLLDATQSLWLGKSQGETARVLEIPARLDARLRAVVGVEVNRLANRSAALIAAASGFFVTALCAVCHAQSDPPVQADARQVRITTKFVQGPVANVTARHPALKNAMEGKPVTLRPAEMQELMRELAQEKVVDLIATPSVTTRSGQEATVAVAREVAYPTEFEASEEDIVPVTFETILIGARVEVNPSIQSDGVIQMKPATAEVNEILGFVIGGRENLKADGKGRWRFAEAGRFVACANLATTRRTMGGITSLSDVMSEMKLQVKKGEVSKPVFSTKKWSDVVSLKQGEWMVRCLTGGNDADAKEEKRIWFFASAEEAQADPNQPSATVKVRGGSSLLVKAQKIILPRVQFDNATLSEALDFFRRKARDLDPEKEGLNIVLMTSTPVQAQISLDLRDVPLNQALQYVSELSGMSAVFEPSALVIHPLSSCGEGAEQLTKKYHVPGTLLVAEMDVKKWLALHGVAFSEGASAIFIKGESELAVKNVPQELRRVDAILKAHGVRTQSPEPPAPAIVKRAQAIVIPKIDFRGATLAEAVQFLRVKSRQLDPGKKGVNLTLIETEGQTATALSLNLKNVPLWNALRYVSELAGMRLEANEEAIVIQPWVAEKAEVGGK